MPTVERATEACVLGEGPHWDIATQSLYFIDIYGQSVLKYTPKTNKLTKASLDKQPSFVIPIEGRKNEFILSLDDELVVISWDGESDKVEITEKLRKVDPAPEGPRKFNDGKCDSFGRLWAGAHKSKANPNWRKTEPLGFLCTLDSNRQFESQVDKVRFSNGLAFDDKNKKFYYIDSLKETVDRFDFDISKGTVSNRQVWFTQEKFNISGVLDGMTIDNEGNLWVAVAFGGRVLKISGEKSETLLDTVELPAILVTSVTFGGENLDELYVTTGAREHEGKPLLPPVNGATYRITGLGVKGLPATNFKLN